MLLDNDLRQELVKKLDSYIKLKNPIAEMFDGVVLNAALKYLDQNYGDKIPSEFTMDIQEAIEHFVNEDWEGLASVVPDVIEKIVDIPGLDDDLEGKFFAINAKAIFEFLEYLARKNR